MLAWGLLNCFWLVLFRRPGLAGAASLTFIVLLILLSQLKHGVLFMTVNFVDLMIIDWDTIGFLLTVWLWTSLSGTTWVAGLIWVLFGVIILAVLTKGFRRQPPVMDFTEEDPALSTVA